MKIRSMTATFGKLDHETLTLEPGLNIIQAPNEWGKSTWCAFLGAMLYGIDTRTKSTKTSLADKEHYAPWSGTPMSGRIALEWKGREITIERRTRGRVPMGEFSAYETETGLPVPELTGANCGEMLLGVERSVFARAGFIRFRDMPLTQDDALRRRLNALVSTGDESGDGERLARDLKDLKNRCRYNRSGLLPKAEAERAQVEEALNQWQALTEQEEKLRTRLTQVIQWQEKLENHRTALRYEAARENARRVRQAQAQKEQLETRLRELEQTCAGLPPREELRQKLEELERRRKASLDTMVELASLPRLAPPPEPPAVFRGSDGDGAVKMAREDAAALRNLRRTPGWLPVPGALLLIGGIALAAAKLWIPGILAAVAGLAELIWGICYGQSRKKAAAALEEKYGSGDPEQWERDAEAYRAALNASREEARAYHRTRQEMEARRQALEESIRAFTAGEDPDICRERWQDGLNTWDAWADVRREYQKAENLAAALEAMVQPTAQPSQPDVLDYQEAETARLLSDAGTERQQLESRLNQYRGRMDAMESRETLRDRLARIQDRIAKLEELYGALTLAQQALADAVSEFQRRFAPRISRRAEELMGELTGGRYTTLHLGEDLSLMAGAEKETTLWNTLWRSDGTVDQLYLALRLAVAEALTEEAPLVLDDALVRFDDRRAAAALRILQKEAENKQVLLFTCQSREKQLLGE